MLFEKHLIALIITVLVVGASFGAAQAQRELQEADSLFIPVERSERMLARQPDLGVTRTRSVMIDWTALQTTQPGDAIRLNLFEDVNFNAIISSVSSENGVVAWVGQISNDPMAQAFIVSSNGQVAADVVSPQGLYQVRSADGEVHTIQQIDQSVFPEELPPVQVDLPQQSASIANSAADFPTDAEDGSVIDVLVVYTPRARTGAGGQTSITNLVNLAVAETNQSYANSGISQRLRLVNTQEISYTEAARMEDDLTYLQGTMDSYMNQVHTLRNTYNADLVSLIIEASQYCGIAYQMDYPSAGFASYGFSVVARNCATGYYSFAHELGHNMGARHDWYVDAGTLPNTYSHGYLSVSGRWRSIMAYNSECEANGVYCTRVQYWANPNVQRGGLPMGVPAGTNATCRSYDRSHPQCDAHDARTLNDTAVTVANFRIGPSPLTSMPYKTYLPAVKR